MMRLWTLSLCAVPLLAEATEDPGTATAVARRQVDAPDVDSFRLRAHHSVALLDDYLYIVGGEVSQFIDGVDDDRSARPVNSTLSIPLRQKWTNSSVPFKTIDNGDFPNVKDFGLWVDDAGKRIYRWGGRGLYYDERVAEETAMWVFQPDGEGGGEWTQHEEPDGEDEFKNIPRTFDSGCATCGNTGFCVGGVINNLTDSSWSEVGNTLVKSVTTFDMETEIFSSWPIRDFNGRYLSYRAGRAVCGSVADANPLLLLGGWAFDSRDPRRNEMSFVNLTWYDTETETWHWQRTSGDFPLSRSNFCAAGARSRDGTYEVFMYGGLTSNGGIDESLSDIYVLSIPAFQWFRVPVEGTPRSLVDCAATESGQIIVVGGMDFFRDEENSESSTRWKTTDKWAQGLGVFDLHSWQWRDSYDPEASPYRVSDEIREWYADGRLERVEWSTEEVKNMFAGFELSPDSGSSESTGGNKRPIGAIVGGTIGGVVALLAGGGLIWWFLRRRKSSENNINTAGEEAPTGAPIGSSNKEILKKDPQELYGSGHPPSPQELYDPGNYETPPRQELDSSEYRLVSQ